MKPAACILTLIALILAGCSQTTTAIKDIQQKALISIRKPGEKMSSSPEDTAKRYACAFGRQNRLIVEEVDAVPDRISAGDEINQRIRYAFCPAKPSGTERGRITRSILYRGQTVFEDTGVYEFKPGTWTVDAFIEVPTQAKSGVYAVEVSISYSQDNIRRSNSFVVK
ncbi:MAG: hypothetical protein ACT4NX_03975 [Deltaproteobacteria bacterium]